MNAHRLCTLLTLAALLTGCAGAVKVDPAPGASTPPAKVEPAPTAPATDLPSAAFQWPNAIGAYREALGEGLVVTGTTSLDKVRVEVKAGGQLIRTQEVGSKDGGPGPWSFTMPAPAASDATVTLINPADGSVLATGALSPEMFVGLFHSSTFTDTRVDAKATDLSTLRVSGKVKAGERIRVEFYDPTGKQQSVETLPVTNGTFAGTLPWPQGASHLRFHSLGGKETPALGLIIQIVAR